MVQRAFPRPAAEPGGPDVPQSQAGSALLFLYRCMLHRSVKDMPNPVRARRARHLPVVITRDEVKAALHRLHGYTELVAALLYGSGLRLLECLRLRVQNIDFGQHQIIVRDDKGAQDRLTMLPVSLKEPLWSHLNAVKELHQRNVAAG